MAIFQMQIRKVVTGLKTGDEFTQGLKGLALL
jgi:hypothetical protein